MNQPAPDISLFEPADDEAEAKAIAEGLAQADAGEVVPLADVLRWLDSWGKPDELPPPPWK